MTPAERIAAALHRHATDHNLWMLADFHQAEPMEHDYVLDALCPKGERVVLDRTSPDTDRLAEPFNIELLTERLRLANARLLAYDGDFVVRNRLEAKAEGVRLALSYISDMTREDGPDE